MPSRETTRNTFPTCARFAVPALPPGAFFLYRGSFVEFLTASSEKTTTRPHSPQDVHAKPVQHSLPAAESHQSVACRVREYGARHDHSAVVRVVGDLADFVVNSFQFSPVLSSP